MKRYQEILEAARKREKREFACDAAVYILGCAALMFAVWLQGVAK